MRPVTTGTTTDYAPDAAALAAGTTWAAAEEATRRGEERLQSAKAMLLNMRKEANKRRGSVRGEVNKAAQAKVRVSHEMLPARVNALEKRLARELRDRLSEGLDQLDNSELLKAAKDSLQLQAFRERQLTLLRKDSERKKGRVAAIYTTARRPLINAIGQYCSYCEMPMGACLAVEHLVPKEQFPALATTWVNFLLACAICNSQKGNQPTWEEGQDALTLDTPATPDSVARAAHGLLLWPNDTDYTRFSTSFWYGLYEVLYGPSAQVISRRKFTRAQLVNWALLGAGGTIEFSPPPTEGTLVGDRRGVWIHAKVGRAITQLTAEVAGEINTTLGEFYGRRTTPDGPGRLAGTDLPAGFVTAMNGAREPLAHFTGDAASEFLCVPAGLGWALRVVRTYLVDASNQRLPAVVRNLADIEIPITVPDGVPVPNGRKMLGFLVKGVLPDYLITALGIDPVPMELQVAKEGHSRSVYRATLTRTFALVVAGTPTAPRFDVSMGYETPVELRIVGRDVKAKKTLEVVGMNRVRSTNVADLVDRRLYRRTRTWFAAIAAVKRAISAYERSRAAGSPVLVNDVVNGIGDEIQATGCWTVWYSVFTMIPDGYADDVRAALVALLANRTRFPGTR